MNEKVISFIIAIVLLTTLALSFTVTLNSPSNQKTQYNSTIYFNCSSVLNGKNEFNEAHGSNFDDTTGTKSTKYGAIIRVNKASKLVRITKDNEDNSVTAYLLASNQSIIASASFSGNSANFSSIPLTAGTDYYIAGSGTTVTHQQKSVTFPISGNYINWTGGLIDDSNNTLVIGAIESIDLQIQGVNVSLYLNDTGTWTLNSTQTFNSTSATERAYEGIFSVSSTSPIFSWSCKVCDQNSTCNYSSSNNTLAIWNVSYSPSVIEGESNSVYSNLITFDSNEVVNAKLRYNNTLYTGSIYDIGGYAYLVSRNVTSPEVLTSDTINLQWEITLYNGTYSYYNSTSFSQTVQSLIINDTCTAMYPIYNFTMLDEINQATINQTDYNTSMKVSFNIYDKDRSRIIQSYSKEFSKTNPISICINNNLSGGMTYSLDAQVQYSAEDEYSSEFYNIENATLDEDNLYQAINLYDLSNSTAQRFKLFARDTKYLPLNGALIKIERKYIENGTFFTTEIPKTDAKGITTASLQLDDTIYNFYIYQNGSLISSFINVIPICQNPSIYSCEIDFNAFQTEIQIPDYASGDDFNFTLEYNSTSRIILSQFLIPSGTTANVTLQVIAEDALGTSVCTDELISSSGSVSCTIPNSFGNSTVLAKLFKDGVEQGKGQINLSETPSEIFGVILVITSLFVVVTLIGIGLSDNPIITILFVFVGVIILMTLNLIKGNGFIGAGATILFLAIAIIIFIIKAGRRS